MLTYICNKILFLKWCAQRFSALADIFAVAQLSKGKANPIKSKIKLHPKALGGKPVYCRPATTDWATLCSTINDQYHLPPEQCKQFACIVDLGANVGYTAAHFACLYPQSQIVAVEMDACNYKMASENTRHWMHRIVLVHAAVWTVDGEVTYISDTAQDAYKIQTNHSDAPKAHTKTVPSISMPKLIEQFNLKHIDYLKVDIEGAESELFLGASLDWLIVVETMKIEIHRPQDMEKYYAVLEAAGFTVYKDNHHWSTISAYRASSSDIKKVDE